MLVQRQVPTLKINNSRFYKMNFQAFKKVFSLKLEQFNTFQVKI